MEEITVECFEERLFYAMEKINEKRKNGCENFLSYYSTIENLITELKQDLTRIDIENTKIEMEV